MMVTCMRMISHQRLPKPRFEIRAEQNADGGVAVSKSGHDDEDDDNDYEDDDEEEEEEEGDDDDDGKNDAIFGKLRIKMLTIIQRREKKKLRKERFLSFSCCSIPDFRLQSQFF